jgi:hypothetical protein
MGGIAGHISHLHEDYDLTLNELIDIVKGVTDGSIEAYEKFDGINVVLTWSKKLGLRFARSKADVLAGGMGRVELAEKFAGRPGVYDAFIEGFDVLEMALHTVPDKEQFFADGERWMSAELCSTKNVNVIQYDTDMIVFHDFPTFNGHCERIRLSPLWTPIMVELMPMSVDGWVIIGHKQVVISDWTGDIVDAFVEEVEGVAEDVGTPDAPLSDVYTHAFNTFFGHMLGSDNVDTVTAVAHKVLGCDDAMHLRDLNKLLSVADRHIVRQWLDDGSAKRRCLGVIDDIITTTAMQMLKPVCSTMINTRTSHVERTRRLRKRLERTLDVADPVVDREHVRLGDISNANAFIEGVVFAYKGKQYKLTGAFAPTNRILGVERFKR